MGVYAIGVLNSIALDRKNTSYTQMGDGGLCCILHSLWNDHVFQYIVKKNMDTQVTQR